MPTSAESSLAFLPEPQVSLGELVRLSVDQYHELAQVGILTTDNQVELLEGLLVRKMTKNRAHSLATRNCREALERLVPAELYVDSQEPITTLESEPEPDGMVVRGKPGDYRDRHPTPGDVVLVLEVADASLSRDRGLKQRIYARAGIPSFWIINLLDRQVEVYSRPVGAADKARYEAAVIYKGDDEVPVVLDGREVGRIKVAGLLA